MSKIAVFEPIYKQDQKLSESKFQAYAHTSNEQYKDWREFRLHVELYRKEIYSQYQLTGIFSPKFRLKTRLSGEEFVEFCEAHESADVIFVNPFPQMPYHSYNIWMQAEANHPGITHCAQNLLNAAGIDLDLSKQPRHNNKTLAYSSFWVGSQRFWKDYVGGVLDPLARFIDDSPDHPAVINALLETYHTDPTPYLPFITERLFTAYISVHPELNISSISLDPIEFCMSEGERDYVKKVREEIDTADSQSFFPQQIIDQMNQHCIDSVQTAKVHFQNNPHPHTGRTIPYKNNSGTPTKTGPQETKK